MKYVILALAAISLMACKSEAEKKAEFIAFCSNNEFTTKQCEVLYMIAKSSSDANDAATAASISSSIAVGVAAGSSGYRK